MFSKNIMGHLITARQGALPLSTSTRLSHGRKVSTHPAWVTQRAFSLTTPTLTEWKKPPQATLQDEEHEKTRAAYNKIHYAYFLQSALASSYPMDAVDKLYYRPVSATEKLEKAIQYEQWEIIPELLKNMSKTEVSQLPLPKPETLNRMPKEMFDLLEGAQAMFSVKLTFKHK